MEVDLFMRHNELSRWLRGRNPEKLSPAEQEIYDKLVTGTHEVEQERDAYIKEFYEEKFQEEGERAIQEDERGTFDRFVFGDYDEDVVDHVDDPVVDHVGDL